MSLLFKSRAARTVILTGVVLADRKSPVEIQEAFNRIYGQTLNLSSLGTLNVLEERVHAAAKAYPDDLSTWGAS